MIWFMAVLRNGYPVKLICLIELNVYGKVNVISEVYGEGRVAVGNCSDARGRHWYGDDRQIDGVL